MVNKVIDFMSLNYDNVQMFSKTKPKDRSYCSLCSGLLIKVIFIYVTTYPLYVTINTKYHIKSWQTYTEHFQGFHDFG